MATAGGQNNFLAIRGVHFQDLEDIYPGNRTIFRILLEQLRNLTMNINEGSASSSSNEYDYHGDQRHSSSTYNPFDVSEEGSMINVEDFSSFRDSVKHVQTATIVSFAALVIVAVVGFVISRHCCSFGNKPPGVGSGGAVGSAERGGGNQNLRVPRGVPQFNFIGAPAIRRLNAHHQVRTSTVVRPSEDLPPSYDDLFPIDPQQQVPTVSIVVENQLALNGVVTANNSSSVIFAPVSGNNDPVVSTTELATPSTESKENLAKQLNVPQV